MTAEARTRTPAVEPWAAALAGFMLSVRGRTGMYYRLVDPDDLPGRDGAG